MCLFSHDVRTGFTSSIRGMRIGFNRAFFFSSLFSHSSGVCSRYDKIQDRALFQVNADISDSFVSTLLLRQTCISFLGMAFVRAKFCVCLYLGSKHRPR